jgi:hypothetical protein
MFRPGFIQPLRGVRSKTRAYQALYSLTRAIAPMIRALLPRYTTTTVNIGRAMIEVAAEGYPRSILNSIDINALADAAANGDRASRESSFAANGESR